MSPLLGIKQLNRLNSLNEEGKWKENLVNNFKSGSLTLASIGKSQSLSLRGDSPRPDSDPAKLMTASISSKSSYKRNAHMYKQYAGNFENDQTQGYAITILKLSFR